MRQDDLVAKLDTNAFVVVHSDGGGPDAIEAARAVVRVPIVTPAGDLRISVRVGRVRCPRDGMLPAELIAVAEFSAVRVS